MELRKKEQELSVSQRVIVEREEELAEVAKELQETESENCRLRRSMETVTKCRWLLKTNLISSLVFFFSSLL